MKKNLCIHGHFYQPPRENPWTGEVDEEPSAQPYHDWNERIADECYTANTRAPILNSKMEVAVRINNFQNISFDIGPTLLSWLRRKLPDTYRAILDADRQSVTRHGGHGNAMAQVYNHVILPLAKRRDKITQVAWGVRDFELHYGRKPEGMWLSETAVDLETLEILADHGIQYTVLAPHQARRVRRIGFGTRWQYLRHEAVDPRHAYRILLRGGRQFHVFFYDAPISRAIAFQGLLFNGDNLVSRLLGGFSSRDGAQLVSTATDGESFGHHHRHGEMAISYGLRKVEENRLAVLSNYAEFLDRYSSSWEVDIYENSSWSCAHGIERWRSDCGCRINFQAGWNQRWRSVLREAFDWLQRVVDEVYEREASALVKDPWRARNGYVDVMFDPARLEGFLRDHARRALTDADKARLTDLLEAEKYSLYMYTSCGWFFDDISGIEPVQMLKYALRAVELVQPYTRQPIEPAFVRILDQAKSNLPEHGTGADVFEKFVKPARAAASSGGGGRP